jgi:GGDEF domain-containing protein
MRINPKSIIFKTGLIYLGVTLLNVTIFNVMVWENQTGLIMENAILTSLHKGSSLKHRIDNIIRNDADLTTTNINKILKESQTLGIRFLTIFHEKGNVYVSMEDNKRVKGKEASAEDLKMINKAITQQSFEDKIFCHNVNKKLKIIDLYIPFTFNHDQNGVAVINLEMKDINKQMTYLYRQCILIALLIVFIHILFAFALFKMVLMPLRSLISATQSISRGQLDIRVPIVRQDEIGQLASSFNEMSVAFQRMRDEAKGANPLTGLPGNIAIARYIDQCLVDGNQICVLYCDLDNFKAYNDKYGFTRGDEAIIYTRDCLDSVAKRDDSQNIFIGHEGGDDFIVVTPFESWEVFAKAFITTFDRGIYQFYNNIDARNGFIESINRQGQRQRFPLMSISISVVSNQTRPFSRHAEMIQVATEVKKYVKGIDGSCYAIDRRSGPLGNG